MKSALASLGLTLVLSFASGCSAQTLTNFATCDSGEVADTSCGFDHPNTAGNIILVWGHFDNQSNSVTSVTDRLGNHYTQLSRPVPYGANQVEYVWVSNHIYSGTPYVTVHLANPATHFSLVNIMEVVGPDQITPDSVMASNSGSGTTQSIGPTPKAPQAGLAMGLFAWDGYYRPYIPGPGYTQFNGDASSIVETKSGITPGSPITATAASSHDGSWAGVILLVGGPSRP